jgi:ADP-ribose pyrophosphatase YjhB (NUDIX family)
MELIEEAVVRELAEETGLEGVCGDLVGVVELLGEQGEHHYVVLDYHVHLLEASEPTAGSDAAEAMWVSLADVAEMRLVDGLAEFLHEHGILETIV